MSRDFRFMKPLLTHSYPPLTATLPACLLPLTQLLTTKEQRTWVSERASFDDAPTKLFRLLDLDLV